MSSNSPVDPSTSTGSKYDPASLYSTLYAASGAGVSNPVAAAVAGLYGFPPALAPPLPPSSSSNDTTLGVAVSQAASLGMNQAAWYAMAQQWAAQDYLSRLAASNPAYAALAAQYKAPTTSTASTTTSSLRLPSDTEIIKYTSSSTGPKVPGTTNRGRKKTISLDPNLANGGSNSSADSSSSRGSTPTIPSGLTIERKKGRKEKDQPIVDKVEITKVPLMTTKSQEDAPLNLSLKTTTDYDGTKSSSSITTTTTTTSSKIPNDYYASQALSGAFLAEQIRQSQLAAALESRLESAIPATPASSSIAASSSTVAQYQTLQAALLMNKLKATAPKTVASLLAAQRNGNTDESDRTEKSVSVNPELTIEPIFKSVENWKGDHDDDEEESFRGEDGRRYQRFMEDGKLKIKTVSDSPEIRNLSDQDSDPESDNEASIRGNREITGENSNLRLPMSLGWKRETLVREYSRSGVRGDVTYYAPCGKKFKQYPDILRYLEKRGLKDLQREHFSFSAKNYVGEYLKPTGVQAENGEEKYLRLSEQEMMEDLENVRKENGWTKSIHKKLTSKSTAKPSSTTTQQKSLLETLQQTQRDSSDALMHKEAMRMLKEAEKAEKARREREAKQAQLAEFKRKKQEEILKQKQEELNRRNQERQQAAILKEQERERRRQHVILIKQLENKKRFDERERRKEEFRLEKERDRERRIEQKRLEYEIFTELRRPCEDMTLMEESTPLPEYERISGLSLSGKAFANILMIFEFLHNFGETLGFDMESLPSLSSLQSAFLNDPETEEELLNVVIHLVVCAIEDPGIPTPQKHLTLMGQTLRQADITNTNISEILKVYLYARAQAEVRACHGLVPPPLSDVHHHHNHHKKGEPVVHAKGHEEYQSVLRSTRPFKMSEWVKDKPFLCLNPLEKSEIVAFICNELLGNKAVMHQVENNLENISVAKKKKWATENKLKKLKMLQQRKFKLNHSSPINGSLNNGSSNRGTPDTPISLPVTPISTAPATPAAPEASSTPIGENESNANNNGEKDDDEVSTVSEPTGNNDSNVLAPTPKRKGRPPGSKKRKMGGKSSAASTAVASKKRKQKDEMDEKDEESVETQVPPIVEKESEDENEDEFDDDIGEEEEKMNQDELQKKVDKTIKLLLKRRDELTFTINRFRGTDLGQDRYRRRYWQLAYVDGIFVEGIESAEPWKLASRGMPSPDKILKEFEESDSLSSSSVEAESDDDEEEKKEEEEEEEKENIKKEEEEEEDKKSEIDIIPMTSTKEEDHEKAALKITPNGDKLNLFNHSAQFNMSLSPVILNGSVTITPKQDFASPSLTIPNPVGSVSDRPWFSILPPGNAMVENPLIIEENRKSGWNRSPSMFQPNLHLEMLEKKLSSIRDASIRNNRAPIPEEKCRSWWRITDPETVRNIEVSLHPRGAREQSLLIGLKKYVEGVHDGSKTAIGDKLELELPTSISESIDRVLNGTVPAQDKPGTWNRAVALRVDKYILEQVEALEDKVAAASMQVPGWKVPNRPDIDERQFRSSYLSPVDLEDKNLVALPDPIQEAKERLLDLELNIERRYLKAPLGFGNNEPTLQTITTSSRTTANSSKTPINEDEPMEDDNSNDPSDQSNDNDGGSSSSTTMAMPRGLQTWRDGVKKATTAAQLAMGFYILETSIAWHKSIMKAFCQLCHSGDNEDSLLLCDGCDKGYHTYCFKPCLKDIPEGDWYCYECINKATGVRHCLVCGKQDGGKNLISCSSCPRAYHTDCLSPALAKAPRGKWQCPGCQQRGTTAPKRKYTKKYKVITNASPCLTDDNEDDDASTTMSNKDELFSNSSSSKIEDEDLPPPPPPPKKKKWSKADRDLTACTTLISELENSEEAWPFLYPVNTKQFPTYRKVIRNPMDIATIKRRLETGIYKVREDFCNDVRQIFANCEIFNEDDSPVGKAGHAMRTFFETRWAELTSLPN